MSKENTRIDNLLFQPLMYNTGDGDKFMMIFNCETKINQTISPSLKKSKKIVEVLKIIDITTSLQTNRIVVETCIVNSLKKFKSNVTIVPAENCIEEMVRLTALLIGEMTIYSQKMGELSSIMSSIRSFTNSESTIDSGNIILAGTQQPLAHIVFKTLSGQKEPIEKVLTAKDVEKIGEVLGNIVTSNLDLDHEDEEKVKRLKAEIEYKIIDSLPNNLRAGDINIDINAVIEEIKGFQKFRDQAFQQPLDDTDEVNDKEDNADNADEDDEDDDSNEE